MREHNLAAALACMCALVVLAGTTLAAERAAEDAAEIELTFEFPGDPVRGQDIGLEEHPGEPPWVVHMAFQGIPGLSKSRFREMVDETAEQAAITANVMKMLNSDDVLVYIRDTRSPRRGSGPPGMMKMMPGRMMFGKGPGLTPAKQFPETIGSDYEARIIVPTRELGEQLARGFVGVQKAWWKKNRQEHLRRRVIAKEAGLVEAEDALKAANQQAEKDKAKLKGRPKLHDQTLADLVTKQLLLDVDIAGVRAKLETTRGIREKISHGEVLVGDTRQMSATTGVMEALAGMKIQALVEQAGLRAQQDEIASILEAHVRLGSKEARELAARIDRIGWELKTLEAEMDEPQFGAGEVLGVVTIQPIDWSEPNPPARGMMGRGPMMMGKGPRWWDRLKGPATRPTGSRVRAPRMPRAGRPPMMKGPTTRSR